MTKFASFYFNFRKLVLPRILLNHVNYSNFSRYFEIRKALSSQKLKKFLPMTYFSPKQVHFNWRYVKKKKKIQSEKLSVIVAKQNLKIWIPDEMHLCSLLLNSREQLGHSTHYCAVLAAEFVIFWKSVKKLIGGCIPWRNQAVSPFGHAQ